MIINKKSYILKTNYSCIKWLQSEQFTIVRKSFILSPLKT